MNDIFLEQLVKKQKTTNDNIKVALAFAGAALASFISLIVFPFFFPFVLVIGFFLAYYFSTLQNIEYEYSFTNTELDVDCIYSKQKRKRLHSIDLKTSEVIYNINNDNYNNNYNNLKTINLTSGIENDRIYVVIAQEKDTRVKFLIEPNDSLVNAFEQKLGRRIFIRAL